MNNYIKLTMALVTGILFFTACDNGKTTTDKTTTDSAVVQTDTGGHKMNGNGMGTMRNEFMASMMDSMNSINMSGDFDIDYATMMIGHHQGAIHMANIELSKGGDDKMKAMAQGIIGLQTGEIALLRDFIGTYKPSGMKHGEGELEKIHMDMKSAMPGMHMTGNIDKDFAAMMIAHHEAGMKMSKAQLTNGMSRKLKDFAKKNIDHETKEVAELKAWLDGNK